MNNLIEVLLVLFEDNNFLYIIGRKWIGVVAVTCNFKRSIDVYCLYNHNDRQRRQTTVLWRQLQGSNNSRSQYIYFFFFLFLIIKKSVDILVDVDADSNLDLDLELDLDLDPPYVSHLSRPSFMDHLGLRATFSSK